MSTSDAAILARLNRWETAQKIVESTRAELIRNQEELGQAREALGKCLIPGDATMHETFHFVIGRGILKAGLIRANPDGPIICAIAWRKKPENEMAPEPVLAAPVQEWRAGVVG